MRLSVSSILRDMLRIEHRRLLSLMAVVASGAPNSVLVCSRSELDGHVLGFLLVYRLIYFATLY